MTREERKRRRLEKILSKPNTPTAFIVLFAFASIFLFAFIACMITTFVYPSQLSHSTENNAAGALGLVFVIIVFIAVFVILDLAFGALTVIFTSLGVWRLIVFLKRRKLKLEHAITDASEVDQIIDLDLSKESPKTADDLDKKE